jgi:hypothetical protein
MGSQAGLKQQSSFATPPDRLSASTHGAHKTFNEKLPEAKAISPELTGINIRPSEIVGALACEIARG